LDCGRAAIGLCLPKSVILNLNAKPKALTAARDKIKWYEDALKRVNTEALKWRAELAALTQENERLRIQIANIKTPDDAKVVGINSRKATNDQN
jgi:hypothetical protein